MNGNNDLKMSMKTTKLNMAPTVGVDPSRSLLFNLDVARLVANAFRSNNSVGPKMLGLKKLKRAVSQEDLIKNGTLTIGYYENLKFFVGWGKTLNMFSKDYHRYK